MDEQIDYELIRVVRIVKAISKFLNSPSLTPARLEYLVKLTIAIKDHQCPYSPPNSIHKNLLSRVFPEVPVSTRSLYHDLYRRGGAIKVVSNYFLQLTPKYMEMLEEILLGEV